MSLSVLYLCFSIMFYRFLIPSAPFTTIHVPKLSPIFYHKNGRPQTIQVLFGRFDFVINCEFTILSAKSTNCLDGTDITITCGRNVIMNNKLEVILLDSTQSESSCSSIRRIREFDSNL